MICCSDTVTSTVISESWWAAVSRSSGRRLCTLLRASSTTDLLSDVRKVEPMLQAANSSEDEKTLTGIASVINSATEQHLETQCSYLVYTVKTQTAKGILLQLSYSTTAATLFCLNYQIRWQNTKKAIKSFFYFYMMTLKAEV